MGELEALGRDGLSGGWANDEKLGPSVRADVYKRQARAQLYRTCEAKGVGITVMKTLAAGKLLKAETSPFGVALSENQCIHYALTRPGVTSVLLSLIHISS